LGRLSWFYIVSQAERILSIDGFSISQ